MALNLYPKKNNGEFIGLSANFAAIGGFGVAAGMVTDAVGKNAPYFSFNGNIGFGMGIDFDQGIVTPTDKNQFLVSDFGGKDGAYNIGISIPRASFGYSYGGSLDSSVLGGASMNYKNFGANERGTTTKQVGLSYSGGWSAGAMYSISRTWVPK